MKSLLFILSLFFLSINSFADQCAWNQKTVAAEGARLLKSHKTALSYCEPCGDKKPEKFKVGKVEFKAAALGNQIQAGRWEVFHNDQGIDLAYIFVPHSHKKRVWENLGDLSKCRDSTTGIEEVIYPGKSPLLAKKGKASKYYGTYESADQLVKIKLQKQSLHGPDWVKCVINIISAEWGDSRSGMVGYLQLNQSPPTLFTSYDKCALNFSLEGSGLRIDSNDDCGISIKNKLTGWFKKIK